MRSRLAAVLQRGGDASLTLWRALAPRARSAWDRVAPGLQSVGRSADQWSGGRLSQALERVERHVPLDRRVALGFAAAVLVMIVYGASRSSGDVQGRLTYDVERAPVTIRLSERGELRALDSVTISAQVDLPIVELAPEGTAATKGDILVRFDSTKYEVALDESRAAFDVAQADFHRAEQELEAQKQKLLADIARFETEARVAELDLDELKRRPLPDELARVKIELERAQVAADNAEKRLRVLPKLVDKGFVTKETMEEAQLEALEAKAALQGARFNFEKVSAGATPVELEKATLRLTQATFGLEKARRGMESQVQSFAATVEREQANVLRAKRLIEKAEIKLKRTELHAPRDGLVVYVKGGTSAQQVQLGMIPFEGQALLYLPDLATMVVDAEVNEIDIGKVKVDGPAEVHLEAYPGVSFPGKILKIGSLAKLKQGGAGTASGVKAFDVTVQIEGQDARLKPGLSAMVDFIVDHQEDAIAIPLTAVVSRKDEHVVFVSDNGTISERKVVLGMSNEHRVIVTEGLAPGERVVLGPSSSASQ
jgi:RND family efflux transporter MFP subunit